MGRPRGSQNKVTSEVREVFAKAFHQLQIDEKKDFHLVSWAKKNPKEFYHIASKLIPAEMHAKVDAALTVNVVKFGEHLNNSGQ